VGWWLGAALGVTLRAVEGTALGAAFGALLLGAALGAIILAVTMGASLGWVFGAVLVGLSPFATIVRHCKIRGRVIGNECSVLAPSSMLSNSAVGNMNHFSVHRHH
jgi:hypothetical protein